MPSSLNNWLKFIVVMLLALLAAATMIWFWLGWLNAPEEMPSSVEAEVFTPSDSILISYGLLDAKNDSAALLPSLYDFVTRVPRTIGANMNGDPLTGFHHSLSPDGKWMTYIDSPSTEPVEAGQTVWPTSIYRISVPEGDLGDTIRNIIAASPLAQDVQPMFPVVSNKGTVVFMSPAEAADTANIRFDLLPEEWNIIMLDADNEGRILTNGSQPHWFDENSFLFFKNDGIYKYSLADAREELVLTTLTPVTAAHRFGLDNQGKQVWLIEPRANATRLFDVERSNGTVVLKEKTIIMGAATSAVFSPEGEHLALTLLPIEGGELGLPLVIYDKNGNQIHYSFLPVASLLLTSLQAWTR